MRTILVLATLAALAPLAAASGPDVRQNSVCHDPPVPLPPACATATLTGTLVGCAGSTCQAAFTLDLEVDGVGRCAAASASVTMPTITACDGVFEATTATGTVFFQQGDAVVVNGLICVGFPTGDQDCILYQETFTF